MCLNILDYWTCWSWGWGTAWKWKGEGESETCDDCNFHKEMGRGWMWKFGRSEGCSLFWTYFWILIMSFTILKMKLHINLLKYLPFPFSCYFILSRSWCLFDMNFPEIRPESFWFGDHMNAYQLGGSTAAEHRASVLHQVFSEFKDFRGREEGKVYFLLQVASGIKT